ncbi:MAG: DNA mismatch repair endonuclease MutL [Isosphaeraceae bacterium]
MGIINQLPASVINQIAAGEVVERPASVVKELLENAIDAGATRIDVSVERGGKDLVRVVDNGRGIDPEDLLLAFLPHATSKLQSAEDLFRVRTLGFRGEALAAIAEVSRVRCQSRPDDAPEGSEITIEAGVASAVIPTGCPPGTVMEVRNLFFNTPVRRNFLKSDTTEAGHVVETFLRIALAHPTVHLTFRSGGRLLHDLPPVTGLRERVAVFFGRELAESLLWVESRVESTHLWGYVAHPSQSRSSTKGQFLFIGGRYVRDRALAHALTEAYRGLLMVGRNPVAFLHLEIPPEEVDVNVHPTKIEVRFRDSQRIYSQLLSTVRQTFLASDLHSRLQSPATSTPQSSLDRDQGASENLDSPSLDRGGGDPRKAEVSSWFQPVRATQTAPFQLAPSSPARQALVLPGLGGNASDVNWTERLRDVVPVPSEQAFSEFDVPSEADPAVSQPRNSVVPAAGGPHEFGGPVVPGSTPGDVLAATSSPRALQVHDSYLIVETQEGVVVIDQHALHERILYEELRKRVEQGGVESQRLLVPETLEASAADAAVLCEHRGALAALGLDIEPFGGDTILIHSTPAMLSNVPADRLVRDLADHLRTRPLPPTRDALLADLLHMIACKAAVKAGQPLTPDEVAALLERRDLVADSHHCPHGRPTALVFTKSELERQFGRI